jgi:hypothetical protein
MRAFISIVTGLCLAACGDGGGDDNPAADAPPGSADAPPAAPTCASYCTAIQANCTAANLQFGTPADCMASCATWMQGMTGATSGNTLACRAYHADAAAASPGVHCRHAGPGGDDACGSNCEGFCTLVQGACTGGNEQYADVGACMTECAMFATAPPYSANETNGDSFACRLYHATAASTNPGTHCGHVVLASPVCN